MLKAFEPTEFGEGSVVSDQSLLEQKLIINMNAQIARYCLTRSTQHLEGGLVVKPS